MRLLDGLLVLREVRQGGSRSSIQCCSAFIINGGGVVASMAQSATGFISQAACLVLVLEGSRYSSPS